jgi:hypothetical protein
MQNAERANAVAGKLQQRADDWSQSAGFVFSQHVPVSVYAPAASRFMERDQGKKEEGVGNTPQAWTGDSKSVIFRSDRTGSFLVYKQALHERAPELVPTGSGTPVVARAKTQPEVLAERSDRLCE